MVAYYAWAMAGVAVEDLPSRVSKGVGRHPQQFALLARLAADQAHEGRRLGHGLLADVVTRTIAASQAIRCRGLLVHFETDAARNFSMHALPEFAPRPSEPIHLLVLVKDLRRAVG